jgi:hypothetical protein
VIGIHRGEEIRCYLAEAQARALTSTPDEEGWKRDKGSLCLLTALIAPRIRQLTRPAILVASVVAFALAPTASANRATVGPLEPVSGASPFAGNCGVPGSPYRAAEVEPHLAVDPDKPRRLVGVWQQDRLPTGGALSNVTASSRNSGRTWRQALVPGLSRCTGGDYERATDPWLAFAPEGTTYLASLPGSGALPGSAMIVHRSTNGGRSWSEPVFADRRSDVVAFNDKETLTADPFRAGSAYMVGIRNRLVLCRDRRRALAR